MAAKRPPTRASRLAGVEGLRAVAAGSIVVYHTWLYSAPDGNVVDLGYLSRFMLPHLLSGVTLFFALSGFLLYRPLAAAVLSGTDRPPTRAYLRNRALRIIPAYWVVLAVTGVAMGAVLIRSGTYFGLGNFLDAPGQLLANALLIQNYVTVSLDTGIAPAWSLAVEVAFYLVLPLLGWIAIRSAAGSSSHRRRVLASLTVPGLLLATGWITAAALESGIVARDTVAGAILGRSFLNHADLFALGTALAVLHVLVGRGEVRLPRLWRPATFAGMISAALGAVLLVDRGLIYRYQGAPAYEGLTSIACILLLALVVLPSHRAGSPVTVRAFEWRPVAAAGLASYSLFLWHEPVVRWLNQHGMTVAGSSGFWLNLLLIAAVAGTLAGATYLAVEKPALARKVSRSRRERAGLQPVLVPSREVQQ